MKDKVAVFWFRRDLRLEDNRGLCSALNSGLPVLPIFIFDKEILDRLNDPYDRRVDYIHQSLELLQLQLGKHGSNLLTFYGQPLAVFEDLVQKYQIETVCCNHDYEPYAIKRDQDVRDFLEQRQIQFRTFKDQVIFETIDILKQDGTPYTVYTPYAKKWREKLCEQDYATLQADFSSFYPLPFSDMMRLDEIGFVKTDLDREDPLLEEEIIGDYGKYRDFPALDHTTHLGIALRFGTVSVRRCVAFALKKNETWLGELIWREFFMQILFHFPKVVDTCFKEKYEHIPWRNKESEFHQWCEGRTGYPIVDAGMRQLNQTGFMHNRVRMIVASFLTKHLLIDWRWGEAYFAQKLLDYDLAANNGNWQWAAGCGCDAAPYFRIFNPTEQTKKFDKNLDYVKRWNPDYGNALANPPIVDHAFARKRALEVYKSALTR